MNHRRGPFRSDRDQRDRDRDRRPDRDGERRPDRNPGRPREERVRPRLVAPPEGYRVAGPPAPIWIESEIGARLPRPRRQEEYGKPLRLGEHIVLRARRGYRAAVQDLGNGQFLVSEVPEAAVRPEMGFLPVLAPAMIVQALKKLLPQQNAAKNKLRNHRLVDDDDAGGEDEEPGMEGCGCRRCRGED